MLTFIDASTTKEIYQQAYNRKTKKTKENQHLKAKEKQKRS